MVHANQILTVKRNQEDAELYIPDGERWEMTAFAVSLRLNRGYGAVYLATSRANENRDAGFFKDHGYLVEHLGEQVLKITLPAY